MRLCNITNSHISAYLTKMCLNFKNVCVMMQKKKNLGQLTLSNLPEVKLIKDRVSTLGLTVSLQTQHYLLP